MATNKMQQADAAQEAMQKTLGTMMPVMLTATFLFIPIPAGVLLYLIASNFIQVVQTLIINKQLDNEQIKKNNNATDNINENAKKVKAKEIKNVDSESKE